MDILPFNFIRLKEEIPPRTILDTTLQDLTNGNLLSSPISSYDVQVNPENPSELHVTHPRPYPLRFKYIKGEVETLRGETHDLRIDYAKTRHDLAQLSHKHTLLSNDFQQLWNEWNTNRQKQEAEKEKLVDWETRSLIAQSLNDQWVPIVTEDYNLLKGDRINYLPHILSVWAVKEGRDPAQSFLDKIHKKEVDRLYRRADLFDSKGLRVVIERVWNSITATDRNTMIAMYLSTRSHPRTSVAHPSPTGDKARHVIEGDSRLSAEEKDVAYGIIKTAVDENGDLMFPN